jgi:hypothetical protein
MNTLQLGLIAIFIAVCGILFAIRTNVALKRNEPPIIPCLASCLCIFVVGMARSKLDPLITVELAMAPAMFFLQFIIAWGKALRMMHKK